MNTKKMLLILFVLICFLFNSTFVFAGDSAGIDEFLTKKSQLMQGWLEKINMVFEEFKIKLKNSPEDLFKGFNSESFMEKAKKSFDSIFEDQKGKIEDFKKEYDYYRGIREM